MPPKQKVAAPSAKQFLESQELFYILDSSVLRLDLSWKNKEQIYDLECKYCNAVYSDHVITNKFSGSRKATSADYTFLLCKNCGNCQNDRGIYKKKFYRDYTAGDIQFPNKTFKKQKGYVFVENPPEIDEEITKLSCYKELPEIAASATTTGGNSGVSPGKPPKEPNTIFLCVTDALIASGLNPYEVAKRKKLIEFYATTRGVSHHDYAAFNSEHNKAKRVFEKEVAEEVDKSTLIKSIAKNAQFGEAKDVFAVETLAESLKTMNLATVQGSVAVSVKHGVDEVKVEISGEVLGDATGNAPRLVRLERKDGCVKTGIILNDGTIVEDETPSIEEEKASLGEEKAAILQSYINKTTGCKSEVNVHEYLATVIPNYLPQGKVSVSGTVSDVHLYGFIDAISGKQGEAPKAVIEIKKRMKQIFSMKELEERRYDLCQLILYKILTQKRYPGCNPTLMIVQSFGEEISIEKVPFDVQKRIIDLYYAGMREFKREIEEFEL